MQADGVVKVADFGIARLEDTDASRSTDEMGAGPYMDPARFSPSLYGRLDGRTDVYSLGVVMYEMLAGRTPFNGDTYELLNQIMHAEPTSLAVLRPDVSPELKLKALPPGDKLQPRLIFKTGDWRDDPKTVPADTPAVLAFVNLRPKDAKEKNPVIVHCSFAFMTLKESRAVMKTLDLDLYLEKLEFQKGEVFAYPWKVRNVQYK